MWLEMPNVMANQLRKSSSTMRPYLKYIIPTVIPLLIWLMPLSAFPFDGITIVQQRVIAIFLLAALCWVFEPIPIYATSVVIIVLELLLISNKGIVLFRTQERAASFWRTTAISRNHGYLCKPNHHAVFRWFFLSNGRNQISFGCEPR